MSYLEAILLSVVEGISEFLPISSTGHLILAAKLLNIQQTEFVKSFEIIIQLGAILAIVFLYWKTLLVNKKILTRILVAFLPTAIVGFAFYKVVKNIFLGNEYITLVALFLGGVALIFLEIVYKEKDHHVDRIEHMRMKTAFLIGLCQSISIIPGVSRAAATILGGLFLGAKRKAAVEFSFLLAVPTMFAASGLDLLKSNVSFSSYEWSVLGVGFFGSFLVAIFAVKFLLAFIQKNTFIPFGVYRILVAILYWITMVE